MKRSIVAAGLILAAGCRPEQDFIGWTDGSIGLTAGDFDDVQQPFNRMVVNTESYEGLISNATWDDEYVPGNVALKVEDLLGEGNDITNHQLVIVSSGTRGLGKRKYNGLDPDDAFVSNPDALSRVRGKVRGSGIVMVTDWAYDLVEQTWPDEVDYLGDDTEFDDAQTGEIGNVTATVTEDALVDALGTDQIVVRYDFSNWAVIEAVDEDDVTVWMRGDIEYRVRDGEGTQALTDVPLLVSYKPEGDDKGTVIVSTFHLDAQTPQVTDEVLRVVVGNFEEQAYEPVEPL